MAFFMQGKKTQNNYLSGEMSIDNGPSSVNNDRNFIIYKFMK